MLRVLDVSLANAQSVALDGYAKFCISISREES